MKERARIPAATKPSTATAQPRSAQFVSAHHAYELAATAWAHQIRAFVRSVQAYQAVTRRQAQRVGRPAHAAEGSVGPHVVAAPPESVTASPPEAPAATAIPAHQLTARQLEIAQLIAQGLSNEEIAQRLVSTPGPSAITSATSSAG